jgi:hypothetical protein
MATISSPTIRQTASPLSQAISSADPLESAGETQLWYRWVYTADLESRGCQGIIAWARFGSATGNQETLCMNNCDGSNTFRHPTLRGSCHAAI